MKKYICVISLIVFPILGNEINNYNEETLLELKQRALHEAQLVMAQEILNLTKDIQINNQVREELIENLCSTAPMNNFTINADISDSLVQNAGDFSGSIFASRDGQNTWFSSSEVSLIGSEGYENTWETSVETSGDNIVDWYLSGVINSESFGLDYGTLIVSQSPNNNSNSFPTPSNLLATIVEDPGNDAGGGDYDIETVSASFSAGWEDENVDRLFFELDLAGGCCDEGGLFGPWYLYGIGIVNPDAESTTSAYAVGYGNGGFGQLSPGLLLINGDLTNGDVAGFEYLNTTYFETSESGDKLKIGVNASDLFNDPNFGDWPNSLEGLILVGVVVEAGLNGLDIAVDVLDQTGVGMLLVNSQHQDGNSSLSLSSPNFDNESNQLTVEYIDSDNNLPWYKAAQICNTPENGGNCFTQLDMISTAHTYSEGVSFYANITEDLIEEFSLSGDYEAHFWFADSDDLGEAQIELPITIGDGNNCLLGDSNGDNLLNVLDVVLLVNLVLAPSYEECADTNGDGILNVLDVVTLVNLVLAP
tara:strand:+ start:1038 stop:2639 length:1602 start_codon:yes stop_codon:yes gene_type:complete